MKPFLKKIRKSLSPYNSNLINLMLKPSSLTTNLMNPMINPSLTSMIIKTLSSLKH